MRALKTPCDGKRHRNNDGLRPFPLAGARVVFAALVPAKGDEDRPLVEAAQKGVEANGAVVVGTLIQRRGVSRAPTHNGAQRLRSPMSAATVLGTGKVRALKALIEETNAEAVVFYNPLTLPQRKRIEQIVGVPALTYPRNVPEHG